MKSLSFDRFQRLFATFGMALMLAGAGLVLLVGGLSAYGQYERSRFDQEMASSGAAATATATADASVNLAQSPAESVAAVPETTSGLGSVAATPTPRPSPASMPAATRIVIPKIKVDSIIQESKIVDGEWQVPKFIVGHLEGTANPGERGNAAFTGHLESIASGNVFANLKDLEIGDAITVYAVAERFDYRVTEKRVVKRDDLSVVQPTPEPTLTLITCAGTFDYLARQFTDRLIIIAKPETSETSQLPPRYE